MTYVIPSDTEIVMYVFKKRELPEHPTSQGCMKFLIHSLQEAINIADIHIVENSDYIAHLTEFLIYVRTSKDTYDSSLKQCFSRHINLLKLHTIL